MKLSKSICGMICSVFLVGCGGSSDNSSTTSELPATPTEIVKAFATLLGVVGYNPIANTDVLLYNINGNLIIKTVTDNMGRYNIQIQDFGGPFLLKVPDADLVAVIPQVLEGTEQTVYITEFTTLIYEAALASARETGELLTAEKLSLMYTMIIDAFRFDPLITSPSSADYTMVLTVMNMQNVKKSRTFRCFGYDLSNHLSIGG